MTGCWQIHPSTMCMLHHLRHPKAVDQLEASSMHPVLGVHQAMALAGVGSPLAVVASTPRPQTTAIADVDR